MPPTAEEQIAFLTKIQRILAEGQFTATYKYALLLVLADLAVESGDDSGLALVISTKRIAEKFIQDGGGYSFSANLLGPRRILTGIRAIFGPENKLNAVSGTGVPINLPVGNFASLLLLGTGVDGDQASQVITVTYTDGTTSQFTQSFSDWFTPQNYPGEQEAVAMPYRDVCNGTEDNRTFNLYAYTFDLDSSKTLQSLTLPNNQDVVVLAVTLTAAAPADSAGSLP